MEPPAVEEVVRSWTSQFAELGAMPGISHVQIFANRGEMMGASNPHPHCQIWATSSIPQAPSRELSAQSAYLQEHGSCLLCQYVKIEDPQQERIIFQNDAFVAMVPFWAVWPFEV